MKKFFNEFKTFISKGNVMDLAIGVIIGGMFSKIVTSFTNDIIMPFVSLLTGKTNFANMFWVIKGEGVFNTLEEAQNAGATIVAYGNLLQLVIDFLITALCLFILVKAVNKVSALSEDVKKDVENRVEKKVAAKKATKKTDSAKKEDKVTSEKVKANKKKDDSAK